MFRFVSVFTLISCAFAGFLPDELHGRIVNGNDTTIEAHPFQVSLQTKTGFHFCGGAIIDSTTIVTAAHCLQTLPAAAFVVRLGSTQYNTGGQLVEVVNFKYHEDYNPETMVNDVGVLKLASPVQESRNIRYIKLAKETPSTGTPATVTGWGAKCYMFCDGSTKTLQEVEVNIADLDSCSSSEYLYGSRVKETMFCAFAPEKDSCQADSGGPLVANNQLVGLVSWGIGCAKSGYPGVYTDISSVRTWVEKNVAVL